MSLKNIEAFKRHILWDHMGFPATLPFCNFPLIGPSDAPPAINGPMADPPSSKYSRHDIGLPFEAWEKLWETWDRFEHTKTVCFGPHRAVVDHMAAIWFRAVVEGLHDGMDLSDDKAIREALLLDRPEFFRRDTPIIGGHVEV